MLPIASVVETVPGRLVWPANLDEVALHDLAHPRALLEEEEEVIVSIHMRSEPIKDRGEDVP